MASIFLLYIWIMNNHSSSDEVSTTKRSFPFWILPSSSLRLKIRSNSFLISSKSLKIFIKRQKNFTSHSFKSFEFEVNFLRRSCNLFNLYYLSNKIIFLFVQLFYQIVFQISVGLTNVGCNMRQHFRRVSYHEDQLMTVPYAAIQRVQPQ